MTYIIFVNESILFYFSLGRVKQKKSVGSVFTDTADSVPSKFLSEIAAGYKEAAIVGRSGQVFFSYKTVK